MSEFSYKNSVEYLQGANKLINLQPDGVNILNKSSANGKVYHYKKLTNELVALDINGKILTYFKPDPKVHGLPTNLDYFNAQ